ncbi:MAG: carboxypeptidase regulatory-like domain-containing protein [Armatimonadota bacterium]
MMTTHTALQRSFVSVIVASILLTGLAVGTASAAGVTLGYGGDGIFPREATANSQRWFRVHITWNITNISDGTYGTHHTERVTGLYLENYDGTTIQSWNNSVVVDGGLTYQGALRDAPGLKNFFNAGRDTTSMPGALTGSRTAFGVHLEDNSTSTARNHTLTIGPFSHYEWELLVGRMGVTNQNGARFRFRMTYQTYSTTDHAYGSTQTVYSPIATQITTPLAVPRAGIHNQSGVDQLWTSGEMQAWYSGVGTGVDPLTVTRSASGSTHNQDDGAGSDRFTFRTRYFSGLYNWPALPCIWRSDHHGNEGGRYVSFDTYVGIFHLLASHQHNQKTTRLDTQQTQWLYDREGDLHLDRIGDGAMGSYNPETILIIDRDYNNPHYMQAETGSYSGGRDFRYDLLPTNFLQLLNNIFTLGFDTPYQDPWDTYASGIRGLPTSNGYVAMRAGGHTYEFLTTRDFHPPVAKITVEQGGATKIGYRAFALRARPGNALEAVQIIRDYQDYGRYTAPVHEWLKDGSAGGYGYPFDSQDMDKYPQVNPVLSAHPFFQPNVSNLADSLRIVGGVPQNPERGRPSPHSMLGDLGPHMPGALPNPFNPTGAGLPWGSLNGPMDSGIVAGFPGGNSPRRFTNQDTIWPNFVNIYPENPSEPGAVAFRGGKWTEDTTFIFRINYWQSQNFAPQYIQVFVQKVDANGQALTDWQGYSMQKANASDWNFREGVVYYFERGAKELGGPGDYRYYFRASDGKGVNIFPNRPDRNDIPSGWRPPNDPGQIGVPAGANDYYWFRVNTKPTLSNQSVTPASAPTGSDFTYRVTYADQDGRTLDPNHRGDPPYKALVHIDYSGDSNPCTVTAIAGNDVSYSGLSQLYADNELVEMQVRRAPAFNANPDWVITGNSGNTITVRNAAGLSVGDTFRVWFTATMDPVIPVDLSTDYRAGVQYTYNTARSGVELDAGTHRYYYEFWDNWAYWINWQQYLMDSNAPTPVDYKVEGQMVRAPSAGFYEGPEIIENTAPHLSRFYFESPVSDRVAGRSANTIDYTRPEGLAFYANNALTNMYVEILTGAATGSIYEIAGNSAGTITLKPGPWPQNPSTGNPVNDGVMTGNRFRIFKARVAGADGRYYLSDGYNTAAPDGTAATAFHLYVTYTDLENNPPSVLRVQLLSNGSVVQTHNMQKVNPGDNVYADGVDYRTTAPVHLESDGASIASYTIKAQAYDGTAWYGSQYGLPTGESMYYGPLTAPNTITTAAKGPDIAPNQAPALDFVVGVGEVIAFSDTNVFTYNDTGTGADLIGTNPVVRVYFAGNNYRVQSHNPATNTVTLVPGSDPQGDGIVAGAAFEARVELDPPSGLDTDTYTYWVVYTDLDDYAGVRGNPPDYVRVYINNVEYEMIPYDPLDTDMTDGKVYYYSTNSLSISQNHRYYFMASDGLDMTRLPATAPQQYAGPVVHVNTAPTLTDGSVAPVSAGENDPGTGLPLEYVFTVTYTDADGHAPSEVLLHVLNTSQIGAVWQEFEMVRDTEAGGDLSDGGYINGEQFITTAYAFNPGENQIGDGHHIYYFSASDIHGLDARDPASGVVPDHYDGPTINDPPVAPSAGFDPASPNYPSENIPANLTVVDDATPRISWTADDNLDPNATDTAATLRYVVQVATDKNFTTVVRTLNSNVGEAFVDIPAANPLVDKTTYYYRVRTIDNDGAQSDWSYAGGDPYTAVTAFRVTTNHPPYWDDPSASEFTPTGPITTQTPTLDWPQGADDDPGNPVGTLRYRVQIAVNSNFSSPVYTSALLGAGVTEHTVPAGQLSWGVTYYWRVQINDGEIDSLWTNQLTPAIVPSFTTVENTKPEPPTSGFNPTNGAPVFSLQPTLNWNDGSDVDAADTPDKLRYEVQVDDDNDWSNANVFEGITAAGVSELTVTTDLTENMQYWYRVRTVDTAGARSDWTSGHLFWVNSENQPPRAPSSGFRPNNGEETELQRPPLRWNAGSDPDNPSPACQQTDTADTLTYIVELSTDESFASVNYQYSTAVPGQTQLTPPNDLADLTTWYWRVRTVDQAGAMSPWSLVQYFRIDTSNQPPVLSNGQITPALGHLSTTYELSVVYSDADNDPPIGEIMVNIGADGFALPMERDPGDSSSYRNGVRYLVSVRGDHPELGLGGHRHYFYIDGTNIRYPAAPNTRLGPVVHTLGTIRLADSAWNDTSAYEEGDTVYIEVTDADQNQDPGAPDTIVVTVTEEGGDSEPVTLTETGPDTAVFRGSIGMLGAAGASGDGVLNVISGPSGNQITATWADPAEVAAGGSPVSDTAQVTDTIAPRPIAGGELTLTAGPEGMSATINWQAYDEDDQPHNQPDVVRYRVWQSNSAFDDIADATLIATVPAGTQTHQVTGLTVGSDYYFAVSPTDEVPNENPAVVAKSLTPVDTLAPQLENWQYNAEAGTVSFDLTDLSGVDMGTFALAIDGVDVTGGAVWDDSDITRVGVSYTAPDGWGYSRQVSFAVDVSDIYGNAMTTFTAVEDAPVDDTAPTADQFSPANGATGVPVDTAISVRLRDAESGVDADTVVMTFNGEDVSDQIAFAATAAADGQAQVVVTYQPADALDYLTEYQVHVEVADTVGNVGTGNWSFTTVTEPLFEIRGTVTDAAGSPMAGVDITVNGRTVGTDGNGAYRVRNLSAGTYTVTPALAEHDFEPASREVTIGPDASDINFTGELRTYSIAGRITRDGAGVAGVTVSDGTRTAVTDAEGRYTIAEVPSGSYTVTPSRDADGDGRQDFTYTPASRSVTVDGAAVGGVNFTATLVTYSISGTITDSRGRAVSGVVVSAGAASAITNEAGQYTISGVSPSTVAVTPAKAGMAFDPEMIEVTVPPDSTGNNFTAYAEFSERFAAGVHMLAVPATPPTGRARAVDVFGTTAVARWDAQRTPAGYVTGQQSPDAAQLQVRPGAGFFVNFAGVTDVTVPGDPVDATAGFSVGVASGWNQIGNMYQTALPLANITASSGTQVRPFAFIWDNAIGSYRMISRQPAFNSARTYIQAWEAAWFKASGAAGTMNIQSPANVAAASLLEGAAARAEVPESGWLVQVIARVADRADVTTVAGVGSGDASAGYRVENPPMMPGSVDVYFTDDSGLRLAHDIRPQSSGSMIWPFAVETDIANAEVEITLPDLSGVPNEMAVYLTDLDSGKRMYARTLPVYSFTTGADGALRHFELEVAPRGADNLTIRTASVQAGSGGLMVTYDVSCAANVSIEVLNIAGRSVRKLVQSRAVPAGGGEQMWDMRSGDGTIVPNGSYLIRIEAVAENGQRVQALRPAQIAR